MRSLNLLKEFDLTDNNYHIIFKFYIGGYEKYPKSIDYIGTEAIFPDGENYFDKNERKKIYEYLLEHYGYPPFNKEVVEKQLKEFNSIRLWIKHIYI